MHEICKELIKEMTQRVTIFDALDEDTPFEFINWEIIMEKVQESIRDHVYAIDKSICHQILLAGNGPTIYFSIKTDLDNNVLSGTYYNNGVKDGPIEIDLVGSEAQLIAERYGIVEG